MANPDCRGLVEDGGDDIVTAGRLGQDTQMRHHPALLAEDRHLYDVEDAGPAAQIVNCLRNVLARLVVDLAFENGDLIPRRGNCKRLESK